MCDTGEHALDLARAGAGVGIFERLRSAERALRGLQPLPRQLLVFEDLDRLMEETPDAQEAFGLFLREATALASARKRAGRETNQTQQVAGRDIEQRL